MQKYLFIDGNSLVSAVLDILAPVFPNEDVYAMLNFNYISSGYQRVFYYDCLPAKNDNQNADQFKSATDKKQRFFDKINRSRNSHVHSTFSKHRRRVGQEQKGIDVLLAIEVLQHAYQGNIDVATVITGDADFIPMFEALTQTRVSSELIYPKKCTSANLIYSADTSKCITMEFVSQWIGEPYRSKIAIIIHGRGEHSDYELIERRSIIGHDVAFAKLSDGTYTAMMQIGNEPRFIVGGCIEALIDCIENNPEYNLSLRW